MTTTSLTTIYLSLLHLKCLGASQFSQLIKKFGTVSAIANSSSSQLYDMGLTSEQEQAVRVNLIGKPQHKKVEASLTWQDCSPDHHLICFEEKLYPSLLREIHSPPPLLFILGNPSLLVMPQLAIVGSRNASIQGKQTAFWLAKELSSLGFCICSGLAAGIDTQAHLGALSGDAGTTAIMGTGPDIIYPVSNRRLANQIQSEGVLVSEFVLGSPPIAAHFPRRNRIISGMSLGVVVVEAALKSGSLITARLAMEQNREVFAVPGSIQNPTATGCHRLIREGAKLVDSVESIVEEIAGTLAFQLEQTKLSNSHLNKPCVPSEHYCLSGEEKRVLEVIGYGECPVDTVVQKTKLDVQIISSILIGLELKGLIAQQAGRFKQVTTGLQVVPD